MILKVFLRLDLCPGEVLILLFINFYDESRFLAFALHSTFPFVPN